MRKRRAFLLVVTILAPSALGACADGAPPTGSPPAVSAMPAVQSSWACQPSVRNRLEHAAEGLLYTSESDFPFEFFCAPAQVADTLTAETFRALAGVSADTPFEEISVDEFFARHIERVDPNDAVAVALVPRYRELEEAVFETLHEPRVYRVGHIAVRCYIVGTDRSGNVAGLTTTAIET
jgi:hypothetical protein